MFSDHRACPNDSTFPNYYSGQNKCARSDERIWTNLYVSNYQGHMGVCEIMTTGT